MTFECIAFGFPNQFVLIQDANWEEASLSCLGPIPFNLSKRGGCGGREWRAVLSSAAAHFGVGVGAAPVGDRQRKTGSVEPGNIGGHKPRAIAGDHRGRLLDRIKERNFTLRGVVVELSPSAG